MSALLVRCRAVAPNRTGKIAAGERRHAVDDAVAVAAARLLMFSPVWPSSEVRLPDCHNVSCHRSQRIMTPSASVPVMATCEPGTRLLQRHAGSFFP